MTMKRRFGMRRARAIVLTVLFVAGSLVGLGLAAPDSARADDPFFADVDASASFYTYIQWMASSGISTGTPNLPGKPLYKPLVSVSRQAMASFLFKLSGASFTAPVTPTFADVDSSNPFDTAIEWMAAQGISTGTPQPSGKPLFKPTDPVSRQAMALFLARYDHADISTAPDNQSFQDVPVGSSVAAAIGWMASSGISTGTPQASGLPLYAPSSAVSRQAMAAFLYRLAHRSLAAPLLETVAAEGLGAQVTWAPSPVSDQVTLYSVAATPMPGSSAPSCPTPAVASASVPVTSTSVVVTGLCAGVAYTAQVTAIASGGSSPPSAASAPVVPLDAQVPGAPLIASVLARDGSLKVAWSSPVYDGGAAVTGYALTATAGSTTQTVDAAADSSTATVSGLTNGTHYSLSLVAVNSIGSSAAATSDGTPSVAYLPAAPVGFGATPDGSGNVTLSWQPPADDGGSAITGYVVTYQQVAQAADASWSAVDGAPVHTVDAAPTDTSAIATTFETSNAFYRFSLTATNTVGSGAAATTANPVIPSVDVPTGTVVLTTASVTALSAVTGTSLSWADPAPAQIQSLVVGDIVVAPVATLLPEGALRAITSIADSGGVLTLTTTNATLAEAFTNLSVASTVNPVTGTSGTSPTASSSKKPPATTTAPIKVARGTFTPAVAGVKLITADFGGSVTLSNSITLGVSLPGVKGEVNVTPSVQVGLEVHQNFVGIPDGVSLTSEAKVVAGAKLDVGISGDHQFLLGEIDGAPIDVQVGPVPVVIVPKVPIFLNLSGSAGLEVSVSITVGASVGWSSQNPGTLTTKNLTTPPTLTAGAIDGGPQSGLSATGSIGLEVQPQADIYDVGGPNFEADLDLTGTIDFAPPPGQPFLSLGAELELKAGLDLDLLGFHSSLEFPIAKVPFASFVIPAVPSAAYSITPAGANAVVGTALHLTATRSDGGTSPLTWALRGSATGDSITSSGVFTAVAPAGRTVTVTVMDAAGDKGQTTVTVGNAYTAPGNVKVSQPTGQPFAAALTWATPSATGGSLVAYYRVVTQPSTGDHTTTALGLTLTGLSAGTYAISIYAVNAAGLTSPAASTRVGITAQGMMSYSTSIAAGNFVTAIVLPNGTVLATGFDTYDALGDGGGPDRAAFSPIEGLSQIQQVSVEESGGLALTIDGRVFGWNGSSGNEAPGSPSHPTPVLIPGLTNIVQVSGSSDEGMALASDGRLFDWGPNNVGELGRGVTAYGWQPVGVVPGLPPIAKISSGAFAPFALGRNGLVYGWGNNSFSELGPVPATPEQATPVQIPGLTGITDINMDGDQLAVGSNGQVYSWGFNQFGNRGDGTKNTGSTGPTSIYAVVGLPPVSKVSTYVGGSMALTASGQVYSWGTGPSGNGNLTPAKVAGVANIVQIAAGDSSMYAMTADGTVYGWGANLYGEQGFNGASFGPAVIFH